MDENLFFIQFEYNIFKFETFLRVLSDIERASFPPRGWNSYDSFSWIISEQEFLENAEIISKRLSVHGYQVHMRPRNAIPYGFDFELRIWMSLGWMQIFIREFILVLSCLMFVQE